MRIIADLHLHSKYARATSPKSDLQGLCVGAKTKGVHVLATGDFTHPTWFKELKLGLGSGKSGITGSFRHGVSRGAAHGITQAVRLPL